VWILRTSTTIDWCALARVKRLRLEEVGERFAAVTKLQCHMISGTSSYQKRPFRHAKAKRQKVLEGFQRHSHAIAMLRLKRPQDACMRTGSYP
jgi:hypothetical protein